MPYWWLSFITGGYSATRADGLKTTQENFVIHPSPEKLNDIGVFCFVRTGAPYRRDSRYI